MKSNFIRFLHITSSYSGLTRISRLNKFATCFHLDTPIKSECDSLCAGRSMVEMLGVLAIIGVLSIGAIASYSKAMFKYKLNKHAESLNMLLNEAVKLYPDLHRHYGYTLGYKGLNSFLSKAELIPDGMTYSKQDDRIHDVFQNSYTVDYGVGTRENGNIYIDYYIWSNLHRSGNKLTERDREICRNSILTAKENAGIIVRVELRSELSETQGYNAPSLYGDLANSSTNNLRSASIAKIDELCDSCNSETNCAMVIYLTIKN